MAKPSSTDVTQLLLDWCDGDEEALGRLMPLIDDELRLQAERYMRRERADHTFEPTALVHETFLSLIDQRRIRWRNRAQFFGVAAQLMRRILLQSARQQQAHKRAGKAVEVPLDDTVAASEKQAADLIALDAALSRLAEFDPQQARIVELHDFGGLTNEEVAEVLGLSIATVKRERRIARAWLLREMNPMSGAAS